MIFHRITITNLFSYRSTQTFDFTGAGGRPVVLVLGRNGFGKTSLLNAVKLLFLGTDDKEQRRIGFPPRNLTRKDYAFGIEGGWAGIRNRHAKKDPRSIYAVRAELGDESGVTITATRSWEFADNAFTETLRVREAGADEVAGAAAEERLSKLLPRELVPFFFFDGEELQFLAEASDSARTNAMERLLSLSFISGVERELAELVKEWRREALPTDVQVQIKAEEARGATLQAEIAAIQQHIDALQKDVAEARDREGAVRRRMDALRSSGAVADARRLEGDIKAFQETLEKELSELAVELATDAPILANPNLVSAAQIHLSKLIVSHETKAASSTIATLLATLPQRLFTEPPQPQEPLTPTQRAFLQDKLRHILDGYTAPRGASPPLLDSLDPGRAQNLNERFLRWNAAMATLRQERARRLKDASAKRAQLERMRAEFRETQTGLGERVESFKKLESELTAINREMGKLEAERSQQARRLDAKVAEERESVGRFTALERRFHLAHRTEERLRIAQGLRETFDAYRQKNRAARRAQIEDAVNRHFTRLMSGHRMIDRIAIDDDFIMRFLDADGAEFGQLTVSHAMRQLAVTALLWALKDVSGRSLPMIVDTFLARIDRENQANLLTHYCPHAADQLIILATDSEIDRDKLALLREHIGLRFRLENPDGQSTRVIRTADGAEGVADG